MPRGKPAASPAASRKTLLEWIDLKDGDTTGLTRPPCSEEDEAVHARLLVAPGRSRCADLIQPPPGLLLAPLG